MIYKSNPCHYHNGTKWTCHIFTVNHTFLMWSEKHIKVQTGQLKAAEIRTSMLLWTGLMGSRWGRGQQAWSHNQKVQRDIRTKSLADVPMSIKHISNDHKFFKHWHSGNLPLVCFRLKLTTNWISGKNNFRLSVKLNCKHRAAPREVRYDPVKWIEPDALKLLESQQTFLQMWWTIWGVRSQERAGSLVWGGTGSAGFDHMPDQNIWQSTQTELSSMFVRNKLTVWKSRNKTDSKTGLKLKGSEKFCTKKNCLENFHNKKKTQTMNWSFQYKDVDSQRFYYWRTAAGRPEL